MKRGLVIHVHGVASPEEAEQLESLGVDLIEEAGTPPPAWTQVEICPSLEDGWRVIRDTSENELDARDLDALAANSPSGTSWARRSGRITSP